jgi:large subunit ribosomal protein L4
MKLPILSLQGQGAGEHEVGFALIENGRGTQAVHDTVVARLAARRRGTRNTKSMGDVNGTGKKPWRQKGTGRARAGSFASPLWRGGGVVHGPKPHDFSKKVNRKVRKLALRKALSERLKAGDVILIENLELPTHKSKDFVALVDKLSLTGVTALFLTAGGDTKVELAARNVVGVGVTTGERVDSYDVLAYDKLVFTKAALAQVEARLAENA